MSLCKVCGASNPDEAAACRVCKTALEKSESGQEVRRRTQVEPTPRTPTFDEQGGFGAGQAGGPVRGGAADPIRRVTVFDPNAGAHSGSQPSQRPAPAARKIVGILVTYSWSEQGQVFPVLEGRNFIGSDAEKCEIVIRQDETLSAINSHIIFRKNFTIGDDVSMGGTDVDGVPVETAFVPLRNYAKIRTGSTHWTFIAIEPGETVNKGARESAAAENEGSKE
jgi:hypothetical protein